MNYWNSNTFKTLFHQIPKLSRPYPVFKDLPCPGKMDFQRPEAILLDGCVVSVLRTVQKMSR